jgi:hypothetical protein
MQYAQKTDTHTIFEKLKWKHYLEYLFVWYNNTKNYRKKHDSLWYGLDGFGSEYCLGAGSCGHGNKPSGFKTDEDESWPSSHEGLYSMELVRFAVCLDISPFINYSTVGPKRQQLEK